MAIDIKRYSRTFRCLDDLLGRIVEAYEDFYHYRDTRYTRIVRPAKVIWETTFKDGQFEKTLEDIEHFDALDYKRQQEILSSLKQVEEVFHNKLAEEATRLKSECYNHRWIRWRIRNEKARLKAEDRFRERMLRTYCGSCLIEWILFRSFRLQEGIKGLIGLRESFP